MGGRMSKHEIEEWRPYPRCPVYQISNLGRVRRLHKTGFHIFHPGKDRDGYSGFTICYKSIFHAVKLHHAVLETFIGKRPKGHICNHKDGIKSNNRATNLEWVTHSENRLHAYRTGLLTCPDRKGIKNGRAKLNETDVRQIRILRKCGETLQSIATKYKITFSLVRAISMRVAWKHVE